MSAASSAAIKIAQLPSGDTLDPAIDETESRACLEALYRLSSMLLAKMTQLSDKDIVIWHGHTSKNDAYGLVVDHVVKTFAVPLCTRARCKFYEILHHFDLLPEFRTSSSSGGGKIVSFKMFHLYGTPSAFTSALNHNLISRESLYEWEWHAQTLNPYHEGNSARKMVADDRLIIGSLENWDFGPFGSGDLLGSDILPYLEGNHAGTCDLVNADGSIRCANKPQEQE